MPALLRPPRLRSPLTSPAVIRLIRDGLLLVLVAAFGAGCLVELDARVEPFRDSDQTVWPLDVDDDGVSELTQIYRPGLANNHLGINFQELDGRTLHQVNAVGIVGRPLPVERPGRRTAVLVPFYRNDSLWVMVVDVVGQRQDTVFVASGRPRFEKSGVFAWDPRVAYAEIHDFDGDGDEDLLSLVTTGYAREPRAFFLHDLASGRLLDSLGVAAGLQSSIIALAPEGRYRRWLLGTSAPDNGVRRGALDDRHSYLLDVVYDGEFRLAQYREMGGLFTDTNLMAGGSQAEDLLVAVIKGDKDDVLSYIAVVDRDDLSIRNRLELPEMVLSAVAPPVRSPADLAILAISGAGSAYRIPAILDRSAVQTAQRGSSSGALVSVPDLDGDELGEVALGIGGQLEILGNDLRPLATVTIPGGRTGEILPLQEPGSGARRFLVGGPEAATYLVTVHRVRRLPIWLRLAFVAVAALSVLLASASALRTSTYRRTMADLELHGLVKAAPPEPAAGVSRGEQVRSGEFIAVPPTLAQWLSGRRTVQRVSRAAGALSGAEAAANNRWSARIALPGEPANGSESLARIVSALDRDALNRDTTVASLAESLDMSQRHLQRTCEALFGLSPLELITRRRVLAAAERLAATDDLVKEIAWDCGFGPSGQMEAAFKKHFGVLPTEYRAAARKT